MPAIVPAAPTRLATAAPRPLLLVPSLKIGIPWGALGRSFGYSLLGSLIDAHASLARPFRAPASKSP